jgi:hypothetical protein
MSNVNSFDIDIHISLLCGIDGMEVGWGNVAPGVRQGLLCTHVGCGGQGVEGNQVFRDRDRTVLGPIIILIFKD